ncbi:hypothetical protein WN55_05075 [Dufourea novaeangliae]|uniref:Shugoshin C-terminal domain-containing protein n=1 Tax=Dufourea novaeangliae TaxID=178035 RepID=A0A154PNU3_DUFNO|nr:hypothetical protein WN55_05075 [Dufourea novaeangliae]
MPQIPKKHRKVKRATVIIKRSQCFRNYPKYLTYKPLCEKLKSNNNYLAKALSKKKQECNLLFTRNVNLIAEVQDLGSACNKCNSTIANISKGAKEMLKMLVTMSGYLTNIISTCQEHIPPANTNLRMSYSASGRRDSYRVTTNGPTRGVVKPMVSGHTITKPTINLSRINMQHINELSNLNIIPEVTTPPRNQETNSPISPVAVPVRQHRYDTARTCRLPERLTVSSPRCSEENERRLSRRSSKYSGRMSRKSSRQKSDRLSGSNSTESRIENFEQNGNNQRTVNTENSRDLSQEDFQSDVTIPQSPPSDTPKDNDDKSVENADTLSDSAVHVSDEDKKENRRTQESLKSDMEDPLEGPSWLFNNSRTSPHFINEAKKTDNANVSINDSACSILKVASTCYESDDETSMEESLLLSNKRRNQINHFKKDRQVHARNENMSCPQDANNETICKTSTSAIPKDINQAERNVESDRTRNLANFVTQRRGYLVEEDDDDDFTLLYTAHPRKMHFDINDLKLPVLEESALKPIASVEPEPEITTTLRKISQICPMPSVSNSSVDETMFNQSTVKLPLPVDNDYDNKDLTQSKDRCETSRRKKKIKKTTYNDLTDFIDSTPTVKIRDSRKDKKDKPVNKDPSTAKVVLEKLNESDVKSRTPSPEERLQDFNQPLSPSFSRADNSSDSGSSNESTSSIVNRLRRKRAPKNFREPSLRM